MRVDARLTQFVQGLAAGDADTGAPYGGKADLLFNADLSRMGLWDGLAMTVHAEVNFGRSVNGQGGVAIPVNTALEFPGIDGSDAYDFSSVFFTQRFGDSASVVFGKINMIDMAATRDFAGGAGIDAFWNLTFTAPPTGTVPPYLFGVLARFQTDAATYHLWVYDPVSVANKSVFDDPFGAGVNIRGSVELPVTIGGLPGHQGFTALYSTQDGTDLASLDGIHVPSPVPGAVQIKDSRYYFAWIFDQQLYRAPGSATEGFGLFGQLGVSDGNPNGLRWSLLAGIGGKGLVPGRSNDNWGIGYYYDSFSQDLKNALAPAQAARRTGAGAVLQLRAHLVERAGLRPAGHPAGAGQRHRGDSRHARGDALLKPVTDIGIKERTPHEPHSVQPARRSRHRLVRRSVRRRARADRPRRTTWRRRTTRWPSQGLQRP